MPTDPRQPVAPGRRGEHARREELAGFLRSRRTRLRPDEVGLPGGGHRRTPGLRREEVAELAGVSASWYTFLEQGRPISVSAEVLGRVADVLRLTPMEADHLFTLADRPRAPSGWEEHVPAVVDELLGAAGPVPMHVLSARFDILAWNEAFRRVWFDPASVAAGDRNLVWLAVTDERMRSLVVDWEPFVRGLLARFRFVHGQHRDDERFAALISRCHQASPLFRDWWAEHEVVFDELETVVVQHPVGGRLELDRVSFHPDPAPTLAVLSDVPRPGTGTRERIAGLLSRAAA